MPHKASLTFRTLLAVALVASAANCFLKYLWWTACYSAWYGIPKLAEQWKAAGTKASLNLGSFALLDLASITILFTLLRFPSSQGSAFIRTAPRLMLAFLITIAGTAVFALALASIKQGIR